jgi:hypothetical protein
VSTREGEEHREKLTLKREKNVETDSPARRVAKEGDELLHDGLGEVRGELKSSASEENATSHATQFLREGKRGQTGSALQGRKPRRTGLSVLSCMRKNSGRSLVMKGKAELVRNSLMLPQIQVRTSGRSEGNVKS